MENIANLVSIVCRFKPKQINIIDEDKEDKANLLYQMLVDDRTLTEKEAEMALYGSESRNTFNKLKLRLRDKLMNMLFFIDLRGPKYSDYMRASVSCYRMLAIFYILRRFGANSLAMKIGDKTIKRSLHFAMAEVSYPILSEMCLYYSSENFNDRKYRHYKEILEGEYVHLKDNHLMNDIYSELFSLYINSRSSQKETALEIIEKEKEQIERILGDSDSFWLNRKGYLILTLYYQIRGEYDRALDICDRAIHFFMYVNPVKSMVTIVNFYVQQLQIYLNQKRFSEGHQLAIKAKKEVEYYNNDWHVLSYLHFLLCMHCKRYNEAIGLYLEVTQNENFKKITPFFIESWSIFEAYAHLVKDKVDHPAKMPRFSINRYVNNIPTFSKDKRGNNITILVAQFIFLVRQKKFDDVIDRVDALKQYAHRYLREDSTLRSNCFIKMLLSVVKAEFNPIRARRYAERYTKKLYDTPLSVSEQSTEIEIIPYEDLWDFIMEILESQK